MDNCYSILFKNNYLNVFSPFQEPDFVDKVSYRYGDKVTKTRITCDTVQTVISDEQNSFLVLICGTRSFEQDMIKCLKELNVTEQQYHKF